MAFWTGLWTGLTALDRSDRGAGLPGGITPTSGLRIRHSIYAFRSSRRDLRNGVVHLAIWQTYLDRSDRFIREVWPVCPNCPENLNRANFGCQHMPPCFLVKFAYQETSLLAKIIEDRWLILVHHLCFYSKTNKTSSAMLLGTNQDNNIIFAVFICTWWVRYKPEYTPPRLWILDAMARTIFTTYA